MEYVKVAKDSDPKRVSKCIGSLLIKEKDFKIKAMGAGAVNNVVKSIAILRKTYSENIFINIKFSDGLKGHNKNEIIFTVTERDK